MIDRNLAWLFALVAMIVVTGPSCKTDDDDGDSPGGSDGDDSEGYCDIASAEEDKCRNECEAGDEPCYHECEYVPPAEKGPCQDACQAELDSCRTACEEAYPDVVCPDEGPGAAGDSPANDNPDLSGDDDPDEDDDADA